MTDTTQGTLDFEESEKKELNEKLEDKPLNTDMQRVASTVLIRAALVYRDMFVPQDIAVLKQEKTPAFSVAKGIGYPKNISAKGLEKMHGEAVRNKIKSIESTSNHLRKEIANMSTRMDKNGAQWIDTYGEFIARCMRQIIPAADPEELYGLMIAYNAGQLDFMFEKTRAEKLANATKTEADETTTPSTDK